jgi:hypothetical protein
MFFRATGWWFLEAGELVAAWANEENWTPKEREAAQMFLSQWPDGPQI